MSESGTTGGATDPSGEPPEAIVERSRGISPIWLIPLIVAIAAASLVYNAIQERGVEVVVLFKSAEGLEAGKSRVKYRDIEVGTVDQILFRDLETIEVHCTLDRSADPWLVSEDAQWWVVRPRVGGAGITGLETLLSGAYLTVDPGEPGGKTQREFVGLEEPPIPSRDRAGLELVLHTDQLGGLETGSRVFFRDLEVGDVFHSKLAEDGKSVEIKIVVQEAYAHRVKSTSRFWNAGGLDLSVGPGGLEVKTESLVSILHGGVAFDSPEDGSPAKPGDEFWLHESWTAARSAAKTHGGLRLVLETGSLGGIAAGNPVYYREVPVGSVVSHRLSKGGSKVRVIVNIEPRHATLVRDNSVFWNASGLSADLGLTGLHVHAESLKALLSGGVAFATPPRAGHTVSEGSVFQLHPEAEKKWLEWEADFTPKEGDPPEKHHRKGRFFHHERKSEQEAKQEGADPTPESQADLRKHGVLHRLFHSGN